MRIIKRKVVDLSEERMSFEASLSRPLAVSIGLLGVLALVLDLVIGAYEPIGAAAVLILCPALGAIVLGAVLFHYTESTVIDVARGVVVTREKALLPLRTVERPLEQFDSVRTESNFSASENRSIEGDTFFTISLYGPRFRLPLFDVEDYAEAVSTARKLSEYLRLGNKDPKGAP